jgi:hypothetical protein
MQVYCRFNVETIFFLSQGLVLVDVLRVLAHTAQVN